MLKISLIVSSVLIYSTAMADSLTVQSVDGKSVNQTYSSAGSDSVAQDDTNIYERCKSAMRVEVYTAKAAWYENNGSMQAYQDERLKALRSGADIGYPDDGIDAMIEANKISIASGNQKVTEISQLDVDGFGGGMVLTNLANDCVKDPAKFIRNY